MIRVGVIGASGYTGAELMRIIVGHPEMTLGVATAHSCRGERIASLYQSLEGFLDGDFQEYRPSLLEKECDVAFIGLPHGEAMDISGEMLEMGKKVVDLSADLRIEDPQTYRRWYGLEHRRPDLLAEAAYGIPELNRSLIRGSRVVANPGCYPTAALLGLYPLARRGMISGTIVVDAKSGVSGAGRKPSPATHFSRAAGNISPYAVKGHRHLPEIFAGLRALDPGCPPVVFVPHLAPMSRGILSTMYVPVSRGAGAESLRALYDEDFAGEPFVKVLSSGIYPETKAVRGSNNCHIAVELDEESGTAVVVAAIDNLVKGASGQAVQNMNLMCGLPEDSGLAGPGLFP